MRMVRRGKEKGMNENSKNGRYYEKKSGREYFMNAFERE